MPHSLLARFTVFALTFALTLVIHVQPLAAQDTGQNTAQDMAESSDPAPAALPDMAEIEQAWQREDFVFVRRGLERLARETGSALAQYRYGRVLLEGRGGPTEIDEAADWLQKAVDQNHAPAAALLAKLYLSNLDRDEPIKLQRDPARAVDLLELAAALGLAEGQYELSRLYSAGLGVERDDKAAFRWLLAAAGQQHVKAQFALALAYSSGRGTKEDVAQTIEWLTVAGENGYVPAQYTLGRTYARGESVPQDPEQAVTWFTRAAEAGLPAAQRQLGGIYLTGQGAAQDVAAGVGWLEKAAKGQDVEAMVILGRAYATGQGVARDDAAAAKWYARADQFGYGGATLALAAMYEVGRGVAQDFDRALELYQKALSLPGGEKAAVLLGQMAVRGKLEGRFAPHRMVPWGLAALQNGDTEAQPWLQAQARAGLREAQAGLAAHYLNIPERAAEGAEFLELAARGGDPEAQQRLGRMYMTGEHVALDYVAAHSWFNIAATLGRDEAIELRATVAALMTPEQVAEAQARARDWFASEEPQPPATEQSVREVNQ